jgi:hypothetical protein
VGNGVGVGLGATVAEGDGEGDGVGDGLGQLLFPVVPSRKISCDASSVPLHPLPLTIPSGRLYQPL